MKVMTFNAETKEFFEKLYNKKLTDAEVLEYKTRLVQFFSLLIEIDQHNKRKEGNKQ